MKFPDKRIWWTALFLLACLIFFIYQPLFNTFYQQDEWMGVGDVISYGDVGFLGKFAFLDVLAGKGRFFGSVINYIFYKYLTFQAWPFAVFSLVFQTLNTWLVCLISEKLTKNKVISFLSAVFFAVFVVPSQAVIWFGASITTLPSGTFFLLSLYFLFTFLERNILKYLWLSQIFAVVSYLFKESSVFLFIILPSLVYFSLPDYKRSVKKVVRIFLPLLLYLVFALFMVAKSYFGIEGQKSRFVANTPYMKEKFVFNALWYPVSGLPQIYIPQEYMFKIAARFQTFTYGFLKDEKLFVPIFQNLSSDVLTMYAATLLIVIVAFSLSVSKKFRKPIWFSIAVTSLSYLPFIVLERGSAYLDSRYYYLGSIGGAILLASLIAAAYEYVSGKWVRFRLAAAIVLAALAIGYSSMNIRLIQRELMVETYRANERKQLLSQFKTLRPDLPDKPIFYVTGDNLGFYGLPHVKIPLQQGGGFSLMLWYYDTGRIPVSFIRDEYLWNIYEQGYQEEGDKGFGYFWDKDGLVELFRTTPELLSGQIVGFYYYSGEHRLSDISGEIRTYVEENRTSL